FNWAGKNELFSKASPQYSIFPLFLSRLSERSVDPAIGALLNQNLFNRDNTFFLISTFLCSEIISPADKILRVFNADPAST
ncbi:hypothetical protein KA005_53240, partial [bacterium]|nr:hypothetical protein [bacterium]